MPSGDWAALRALPGGAQLALAWGRRRSALAAYRAHLHPVEGPDPDPVLASLLHLHHTRMVGIDPNSERICRRLARAAALGWSAPGAGIRHDLWGAEEIGSFGTLPDATFSPRVRPGVAPRVIRWGVGEERSVMEAEEADTIGLALWRVRDDRGKSLRVVAQLAGMSKDTLNRIEMGKRSPTFQEIQALADALEISVAELTRLPVPAPANGHTDSTTVAVGVALDGIEAGYSGGLVLPVAVLRDRVARIHAQRRACRFAEVATDLPGLIRDLHTTLATGADHGELLELAVYLHVHVTRLWLLHAAAPAHLLRRVVFLALRLAQERGEVSTLAVAGFSVADMLMTGGAVEPSRAMLGSLTLPPVTAGTAGFVAVVTACHAIDAVLAGRTGDAVAPMDAAAEIAGRFDVDSLASLPGPTDAGIDRFVYGSVDAGTTQMWLALEAKEPDRAVRIGRNVNPDRHPLPVGRTHYWVHYGRALAQLRGRHNDAVRALRTAEEIFPTMVLREPKVRNTLAVLLRHSRRGSPADQELRGMARRAGLPV